jgi:predicted HAD superfamily hydrolase
MCERKLVIYGIGKNTQIILDNFDCNNIVGLMDEARADEIIYGKRIISVDELTKIGADAVIIVARASIVKIIYRRIADVCRVNAIDVYDISGRLVHFDITVEKSFDKYIEINVEALKAKIDKADVVSFDIFDTLLMRRTLYPHNIFELAEKQISGGFAKRRINAEMELYAESKHPTIFDIYNRLDGVLPETELRLESEYLIQRESMCEMLKYSVDSGKAVYLVSDMYLPGDIVHGLLDKLGISVLRGNILVSCDYGAFKSTGLFDVLRKKAGTKRVLHIGDNLEADIKSAERYGINDTFHIESALTMLEDSYAAEILKNDTSLTNQLFIGEFISRQLNNPFLFSETQGKFAISNYYEMAYSLIAPLVYCFFGWLIKKSYELQLDCVLLSARDGFILERIYNMLRAGGHQLPSMKYFYTSRAVAVLAGIDDDQDILHAARLAYSGKTKEMLKSRFNLDENEICEQGELDNESYILLHRTAIMNHAQIAREHYRRYIDKLLIPDGANLGLFDFVSSGTCQKALSSLVKFNITGLYFASVSIGREYKSDSVVETMFGLFNVFEKNYHISEKYFFLENIMTSHEPTLANFDECGNPVFVNVSRTRKQLQTLGEIHAAILNYVSDSKIAPEDIGNVDAAVPDFLLGLIHSQYSLIDTNYFDNETLADEFCNRTFDLSDTIK